MILLISAVFPPEPVVSASISHDLATVLSEEHEVTVLTPVPSRPKGFKFESSFGRHAADFIKKNWYDIQCIYMISWLLFSQYFIVRNAKRYSITVITHVQDIYPESFLNKLYLFNKIVKMVLMPISRYVLGNSEKVIAISENMVNILSCTRKIPRSKIILIYNCQNEETFINSNVINKTRNNSSGNSHPFTFMYMGNIGSVAGVDHLIKSFARANMKDAVLIIAGSGSRKDECLDLAGSHNYLNIKIIYVPSGKVNEIQNQADILLLPMKKNSSMSSIPSKLAAYMFSGKPIIASVDEGSATTNAIKEVECGWLVNSEYIDNLADMIVKVCSMEADNVKRYGLNGLEYALSNYSRETNLPKLKRVIEETLFLSKKSL